MIGHERSRVDSSSAVGLDILSALHNHVFSTVNASSSACFAMTHLPLILVAGITVREYYETRNKFLKDRPLLCVWSSDSGRSIPNLTRALSKVKGHNKNIFIP